MNALGENISEYLKSNFGEDFLKHYENYVNSEPNVFIRTTDFNREALIEELKHYNIELEKLAKVPNAFKVMSEKGKVGKTVEFALGKYYIQSLSSMIPPLVLNPNENDKVLDLCAAPGSKTTQLAELMNNKGMIISNEPNPKRLRTLAFNIEKMNYLNVGIIKNKGELLSKLFENYFDKILVDAPCSALGIIQKKDEVGNWWNLEQAEKIASLQFRILLSALKMVKVGGEIVYSTCTLTVEENELILDKLLKKYPAEIIEIELPVKSNNAFTSLHDIEINASIKKAKRIIPWEINSEGFFVCKLKKIGNTERMDKSNFKLKDRNLSLVNSANKKVTDYISQISDKYGIDKSLFGSYKYIIKNKEAYFVSADWEFEDLSHFERVGIKFAKLDNRGGVHLSTPAARILGKHATENIIELESLDELKVYMSGGTIRKDFKSFGQKIVKYKNDYLGSAIVTGEGLKSQFPRVLRTSEIIFE